VDQETGIATTGHICSTSRLPAQNGPTCRAIWQTVEILQQPAIRNQQIRKVWLSSQSWPMPSMSRGVINCAKLFLSHPLSRKKWFDQWAVDQDPVLTSTTSAKIGQTAIHGLRPSLDGTLRSCMHACPPMSARRSNHAPSLLTVGPGMVSPQTKDLPS